MCVCVRVNESVRVCVCVFLNDFILEKQLTQLLKLFTNMK